MPPAAGALPVVDLAPMCDGVEDDILAVAAAVHAAATGAGFFYLVNHGIEEAVSMQAMQASTDFFAHSIEHKRTIAIDQNQRGWMTVGGATMYGASEPDLKEVFFFGPNLAADDPDVVAGKPLCARNRWPAFMPDLEQRIWPYYQSTLTCGLHLLEAIALALDLDRGFFRSRYRKPLGRGQLIRYPPQPAGADREHFGVAPHTDFGCITLLLQDDSGGLEVCLRDGRWVAAPPMPGALVVNIGDLMARWSNDRFTSTAHRVVNRAPRYRHSIALFCDPDTDAVIDPADMAATGVHSSRYEPVTAGDWISRRNHDSFAHYQSR